LHFSFFSQRRADKTTRSSGYWILLAAAARREFLLAAAGTEIYSQRRCGAAAHKATTNQWCFGDFFMILGRAGKFVGQLPYKCFALFLLLGTKPIFWGNFRFVWWIWSSDNIFMVLKQTYEFRKVAPIWVLRSFSLLPNSGGWSLFEFLVSFSFCGTKPFFCQFNWLI
jgi:hypothetical protein